MAIIITDECINCGACEPECPNTAIYEGGAEWKYSDGTSLTGMITTLDGNDIVADDDNEPDEVSMLSGEDTWDCVHPCALLITKPRSFDGDLLRTLGNYGWLDVMGRPDIARAEREIKRVKNLRNSIDDPN